MNFTGKAGKRRVEFRLHWRKSDIYRPVIYLMLSLLAAACNINTPEATPTVEVLISETPTPENSPTPTMTLTPSPTPSLPATADAPIIIASPQQLPVQDVPTLPPITPSPTEGPYEYVIQAGDTLYGILPKQPWGYNEFTPGLLNAIVRLNNMASVDFLPPPGTTLLIPRRTPTPTPEGTQIVIPGGTVEGDFFIPAGTTFECHVVEAGDTILRISDLYNASLELLSALNQNLNWSGCRFVDPSGGPGCGPLIVEGQCVMVPLPTPVPSSTPTASGNETATPTPTYAPARPVYPPEDAVAPPGVFALQWVSAGVLKDNEIYLVEVQDVTAGTAPWLQVTRNTTLMLPASLIPTDGQTHQFQWRVVVARQENDGTYAYAGGQGGWRKFQWQSR